MTNVSAKGNTLLSSAKIRELCDKWCEAAQRPGGGLAIGGQTEQYRLLRNGLQYHELCYKQLVAAIDGLTEVLLLPGLNTVIDQDHYGLWSWCSEVILYRETGLFEQEEHELKKLFETCMRASLVHCKKPTADRDECQKQVEAETQIPHNARYFLLESSLTLAYLAFPLLEAVAKKMCGSYVLMDGAVVSEFTVPRKGGGIKKYGPAGRLNKQCSSLRDLLFLIRQNIAGDQLLNST